MFLMRSKIRCRFLAPFLTAFNTFSRFFKTDGIFIANERRLGLPAIGDQAF
jgi:hypothetical protein